MVQGLGFRVQRLGRGPGRVLYKGPGRVLYKGPGRVLYKVSGRVLYDPKALRTHILRLSGLKTILYKAFGPV